MEPVTAGKENKSSKTAQAIVLLQKRLPNARLIYASATGASEPQVSASFTICACEH